MSLDDSSFNITVLDSNDDSVYKFLVDIFEAVITETDTTDLLKDLNSLYDSFTNQGFEHAFKKILNTPLICRKRNKDVRKVFRFISDFVLHLDNKCKAEHAKIRKDKAKNVEEEDDDEESVHPFLQFLINVLVEWSNASSFVIRYRSCQLLYSILTNIQDKGYGEIDMSTYELIERIVQKRRLDASSNVRAHAVLLSKFFQDPSSGNDPVIAGLCWQMQKDPNFRVRQHIVDVLAACEETIVPVTQRFLFDKNVQVRNSALLHICHRISPRSFTLKQRIHILNQCFADTAGMIRKNTEKKLIPMWFRVYQDKICCFLKNLRVGKEALDTLPFMNSLLKILLKSVKISQVLEETDLDMETLFPKTPLTGEKIYVWRYFYFMAVQEEKLKKYIPTEENLIDYMIKCFNASTVDDDTACALNELLWFAMDIIQKNEEEKNEKLVSLPLSVLRNPFLHQEIIPYAITLHYLIIQEEFGKDTHGLLVIVFDLLAMTHFVSGEEEKQILLKCLIIVHESLSHKDLILKKEQMIRIKNELIIPNLSADDDGLRKAAFDALCSYSLHDINEAKESWDIIMDALKSSQGTLKSHVLKSAFNILKHYGPALTNASGDISENKLEEVLDEMLLIMERGGAENLVLIKGILKLYVDHHTSSPILLAKLLLCMFQSEPVFTKYYIGNFLQIYGRSREEAECLTRSFLSLINLLFDSSKPNISQHVNVKYVALTLIEFAKLYEESNNFTMEEKFQDLLVLKLTRKFLRKPLRFSAVELQEICDHIIPEDLDKLIKLKDNVKQITESLHSVSFQPKNPFVKKSIKFFTSYLKRIQNAINVIQKANKSAINRSRTETTPTANTQQNEEAPNSGNQSKCEAENGDAVPPVSVDEQADEILDREL